MIYYKLDQEIRGDKILSDINNLLSKHQHNISDKILVISIKDITNHKGDNPIPKLTYEAQ